MDKNKTLYLSLGLAALAALFLWMYSQEQARSYGVAGRKVDVVVAKTDMVANTKVTKEMLKIRSVPELYRHPAALRPDEVETVVGQTTAHRIREGQPVLATDFASPDDHVELDEVVKEGWRALTIPVDKTSSFGGLLRSNDHVDILGTFLKPAQPGANAADTAADRDRRYVTLTLLQNVTVLAVGGRIGEIEGTQTVSESRGRSGFDNVTVLVTPEESELLTFALDKGKIGLALRNENDVTTEAAMAEKSFDDIFGTEKRDQIQKVRNARVQAQKTEPLITVVR